VVGSAWVGVLTRGCENARNGSKPRGFAAGCDLELLNTSMVAAMGMVQIAVSYGPFWSAEVPGWWKVTGDW
jgi:hypothetical protein